MIKGQVNSELEPVVPIALLDRAGSAHELEAVVDTGFTAFLTLPSEVIARLGLTWLSRQPFILADGKEELFDVYEGVIVWHGKPQAIDIGSSDMIPLLGMDMMRGSKFTMTVVEGGPVTIEEAGRFGDGKLS